MFGPEQNAPTQLSLREVEPQERWRGGGEGAQGLSGLCHRRSGSGLQPPNTTGRSRRCRGSILGVVTTPCSSPQAGSPQRSSPGAKAEAKSLTCSAWQQTQSKSVSSSSSHRTSAPLPSSFKFAPGPAPLLSFNSALFYPSRHGLGNAKILFMGSLFSAFDF